MISLDGIRDGLDCGEFFLEYMPTIRLSDGHCVDGEALTQWRRPSGIVPPMDFIPQIELTSVAGFEVIAEGVEHQEQFEALRHAGIGLAEGWHFPRSLPVDNFFEFHAEKATSPTLSP